MLEQSTTLLFGKQPLLWEEKSSPRNSLFKIRVSTRTWSNGVAGPLLPRRTPVPFFGFDSVNLQLIISSCYFGQMYDHVFSVSSQEWNDHEKTFGPIFEAETTKFKNLASERIHSAYYEALEQTPSGDCVFQVLAFLGFSSDFDLFTNSSCCFCYSWITLYRFTVTWRRASVLRTFSLATLWKTQSFFGLLFLVSLFYQVNSLSYKRAIVRFTVFQPIVL